MSRVLVEYQGISYELTAQSNQNLLDLLRSSGFPITAPCGGNGTCGKCLVQLQEENTLKTALACQTPVTKDCQVFLSANQGGTILTKDTLCQSYSLQPRQGLGAAVDLGTTTIAVRLFDLSTGKALETLSAWNRQRPYGADVITRCQYCMEHPDGLTTLSNLIRQQVLALLVEACSKQQRPFSDLTELYLAGNTVMQHLMIGYSPNSIAVAPFRPQTLFKETSRDHLEQAALFYAPCVAGYVGGDITAGLLACGLAQAQKTSLFLDVGTNGEMALGDQAGFVCCAVASGPAFEGAGISCGMSSTEGAISHITWNHGAPQLEVIGSSPPTGICGSGLLDLLAMLLELGIVDESGYLLPPDEVPDNFSPWLSEDENGNGIFYLTEDRSLFFTAADVRQLQLAKAAVAAGISVLMQHTNLCFSDLDTLYLAGGFGSHLNPKSAIAIGMFPEEMEHKILCVGNTALSGASMALLHQDNRHQLLSIQKKCRYLELSGNDMFNRFFPEHMTFDKEELPWK